ncbi:MAG: phenylalanine--tRNA ligase beta subunit-related protein [Candidatus Hermodarchaeota archaeon]
MNGVENPQEHPQLDEKKKDLEDTLRAQFSSYDRTSLRAIPVLASYRDYYKQFNKTYHVQHQLESLVFKNRHIPRVAALVEAMFMAEVKNLLLTAGHDFDLIRPPLRIDVAKGTESYTRLNGEEQILKAGDMMIADADGILSCIIYGPDRRTRIRPETNRVVFTVYAPPGIEERAVRSHLEDIQENVTVITPGASVELLETFGTY